MTTLIFVRHGQSLGNVNNEFLGHTDLDLSELGYAQAELAANYIVEHFHADRLYSSDLMRAYNTATAISEKTGLKITKEPRLREIYAGDWEGKTFSRLISDYPEAYGVWLRDIGSARCTNGESPAELQKRVLGALREIIAENDGKTIVIATHATVIRCMECVWKNVGLDKMKDIPWVKNASVSVVEYDNGIWTPIKIGDDSFIGKLSSDLPANV